MTIHIWLRTEEKPLEERTALTPKVAQRLLDRGFRVTVEKSSQSAIKPETFADVGCELAEAYSWLNAPEDTIILGLKELSESSTPLKHKHIHFAHVYKKQIGWQKVLHRFREGGGALYDLEYLIENNGRRVAAFGYWAGYAGTAIGLMTWTGQQLTHVPVLPALNAYNSKEALLECLSIRLNETRQASARLPRVLVIGAKGRSGNGAREMVEAAGAEFTGWDLAETEKGGPFPEIKDYDILINCVFVQDAIPPFITSDMLQGNDRRLSVIVDVSCDPYGDYNPLPLYSKCTTFSDPTLRIVEGEHPIDLISIDHLPSMLPVEASEDFCEQLAPYLMQLDDMSKGVWARAHQIFKDKISSLEREL